MAKYTTRAAFRCALGIRSLTAQSAPFIMSIQGLIAQFDPANAPYIEGLFEDYLKNPESVPAGWRSWFDDVKSRANGAGYVSHESVRASIVHNARSRLTLTPPGIASAQSIPAAATEYTAKQVAVLKLIYSHRLLGHLRAAVNPLRTEPLPYVQDLDALSDSALTSDDLQKTFNTGDFAGGGSRTLQETLDLLGRTYCGSIGVEFMHIMNVEQKTWIQERLETGRGRAVYPTARRKELLQTLVSAEGLEVYLHRRFSGQKRFGLEGAESMVPMLHEMIQIVGAQGAREVVIGMAHRGRLNVLVNILGKQPRELFAEFDGHVVSTSDKITGDVKYHKGTSTDVRTSGGGIHVSLAFNPSHLEIINPVVEGSTRSRQDRYEDREGKTVVPVLIHGDAAVAGQGVVYETLNMAETRGYGTGGTIHLVINNQVGFTTSHPDDARSFLYCTDVGKVVQAPVFHVNGDDPEACLFAMQLATEFRMRFRKDVFIDLVCYRRRGHNEGDDPTVTQPVMYANINVRKTTVGVYADQLATEKVVPADEYKKMVADYKAALDKGDQVAPNILPRYEYFYYSAWQPYLNGSAWEVVQTALPVEAIAELAGPLTNLPPGLSVHPAVQKIYTDRKAMYSGAQPLDWGAAETLAYASLLKEGYNVRLSGQDVGRGTFFHRQASVYDQRTNDRYVPLEHIDPPAQGRVQVIDSVLSEEAVLGFEYGYAASDPKTLVMWEAQFGDFVNGAQVVIDQFISSSAQKWSMYCGLAMFLPHGWEGQGPEHTSGRLERMLQLCAAENIQVIVPSTAGQVYHMLRRQMIRKVRLPLIVFTPKSMLRRKESFTPVSDIMSGAFQVVMPDPSQPDPAKVKRVIACSGKIYYELDTLRREKGITDTAMIRVEQLYPFPEKDLAEAIARYPAAKGFTWVQEEPRNQGAWYQIRHHLQNVLADKLPLEVVSRVPCSAPSGGSAVRHKDRQNLLIHQAFGLTP